MDAAFQFWALIAIAAAIYSGLHAIAAAIRNRTVRVEFSAPIEVTHRHGTPS
jgi:hypothetical protein